MENIQQCAKKCKKRQFEETLPSRKHVGSFLTIERQQASAFDLASWLQRCRILVQNYFFRHFVWNVFDRLSCRSGSNATLKCPIAVFDLKDLYNGLVKHITGGSFGNTDFWTGQKPRRDAYMQYLDNAKARLHNHLKEPFQLADLPPLIFPGWNFMGQKESEGPRRRWDSILIYGRETRCI